MDTFNYDQPFVVVGALIENEGKYVLVKESHGPAKGLWNIPGGKWDALESIPQGAIREVLEETGFQFSPERLLGIYARHRQGNSTLQFIFTGSYQESRVELDVDIDELRWYSEAEIMAMDKDTLRSDLIKQMIQDYKSGVSYSFDLLKEFEG